MSGRRIAIFGGAFDPIHNAHLAVARAAAARFDLDRVLFVPTYCPPHKGITHAPYEDRVNMVEIACAESSPSGVRFEASRLEEGTKRSYSIDTINRLRATLDPADELFFLIGADAFAEVRTWHRWREVIQSVRFVVAVRPGYVYDAPAEAKVDRLEQKESATSSSSIRQAIEANNLELDAPPGVVEYIRSHRLYGAR